MEYFIYNLQFVLISFNMEEYKRKISTQKCGAYCNNGSPCTKNASFYSIKNPGKLRCGLHIKPRHIKNTLHDRKGSFNYASALSIHCSYVDTEDQYEHFINQEWCFYCKTLLKNKSKCIDHIESVIKDGKPNIKRINSSINKVICCVNCNTSKGNSNPLEWARKKDLPHSTIEELEKRMNQIPIFTPEDIEKNMYKFELVQKMYELMMMVCKTNDIDCIQSINNDVRKVCDSMNTISCDK